MWTYMIWSIEGGRPAPQMLFQMGPTNSTPDIINNTQTQAKHSFLTKTKLPHAVYWIALSFRQ